MSGSDPDKVYPYPVKGVVYGAPPWEADFIRHFEIAGTYVEEDDVGNDSDDDASMGIDESKEKEDSPPETVEPGVATFGVELEFLLVQCPRVREDDERNLYTEDPHPNDPRWLSKSIATWETEHIKALQNHEDFYDLEEVNGTFYDDYAVFDDRIPRYTRTKVTRVLRESGLTAIKWPNGLINDEEDDIGFVPINNFSESEDSDDQREERFTNRSRLTNFYSVYTFDASKSTNENYEAAVATWESAYEQHHQQHDLRLYRTQDSDITMLLTRFTVREWADLNRRKLQHLRHILVERIFSKRKEAKQQRENQRNAQADPLHVPVPGLKPQYKAWTVTVDHSVDGNGMTKERYQDTESEEPYKEYHWFGAEVVSPVLPMGDERSAEAVRTACGALRDALRCHKPMEVSTGLHIHMGHSHGWTLYQAKRFATFWLLTERTILQLHRADRDRDDKWCAKIRGSSRLWRALYSEDQVQRERCADTMQRHSPWDRHRYEWEMNKNLPDGGLGRREKEFLGYVWQYDSITALHEGLGENKYCRTGIKWRIRGKVSSLDGETEEKSQPGTIEARIMQGTLDADNINNWVAVLERIVHVVRDYSDEQFRDFLGAFVTDRTRFRLLELLGVSEAVQQYWRDPKRRDSRDAYWEYPDHDKVDWNEPFMVPGHRATHGSFWD